MKSLPKEESAVGSSGGKKKKIIPRELKILEGKKGKNPWEGNGERAALPLTRGAPGTGPAAAYPGTAGPRGAGDGGE